MVTLTVRVNEVLSRKVLLPLANEVWGKIMFLLACVILFTWGVGGLGLCPMGCLCQVKEWAVRIILECILVKDFK